VNPSQPLTYLLLYMAMLYVRPHEYIEAFTVIPLLPIFLLTGFTLWLSKQQKNFTAPQFRLVPWQTFLMIWSVLKTGWLSGAIQVFNDFLPVVMLFFMLATTVDSVAKLRKVFLLIALTMIPITIHCIDQFNSEDGIGWTGSMLIDGRVTYVGFLADPNDLSMCLLMVLPMQIYLLRRAGWLFRAFWAVAIGLSMYTVFLCNSRGAVLAFGAMMLHFGLIRYGLVRSVLVVPVLLAPILLFGPSRMNEMSSEEESAEGRLEAWYDGIGMLMHNPLFGVGKGLFTEHHRITAHNSYVLAFSELGFVGFFVWLANIVLAVIMMYRLYRAGVLFNAEADAAKAAADAKLGHKPMPAPVVSKAVPMRAVSYARAAVVATTPDRIDLIDGESWAEVLEVGRVLWFGFTAALVAIFFLSRSYVPILYIHMALMIAVFQIAQRYRSAELLSPTFGEFWGRIFLGAIGAISVVWVATRVLL
jgi:putative inorganic carbon (HCO3(-)) transporter